MKTPPSIIISIEDFQKIKSIISFTQNSNTELLAEELDRANLVMANYLPKDVVSMNSKVTYADLETQKEQLVVLVYPEEANISQNKISILSPIGSALIGLQVGQVIEWPVSDKKVKRIQVKAVS